MVKLSIQITGETLLDRGFPVNVSLYWVSARCLKENVPVLVNPSGLSRWALSSSHFPSQEGEPVQCVVSSKPLGTTWVYQREVSSVCQQSRWVIWWGLKVWRNPTCTNKGLQSVWLSSYAWTSLDAWLGLRAYFSCIFWEKIYLILRLMSVQMR